MNTSVSVRERGGCLTAYLVATIFFAILGLILLVTAGAALSAAVAAGAVSGADIPSVSPLPIILSVVSVIVAIIGVVGAWTWKKWGIYLIGASFIISALGSIIGGSFVSAVVGLLIEAAILWYLLKDKWALFEG
ncbi:MAG: hypothetical protein ABI947_17630 [Chloroflexota bacterium]